MLLDMVIGTKNSVSSSRYRKFTKQCKSSLKRVRLDIMLGIISTDSNINFKLVTKCGSISTRIE